MAETSGGQPGNQNARYGSMVRGAIRRALAENETKGRDSLLKIAQKLIDDAEAGSIPAASLLFDRIDGKATQVIGGDADLPPVQLGVIELVRPD